MNKAFFRNYKIDILICVFEILNKYLYAYCFTFIVKNVYLSSNFILFNISNFNISKSMFYCTKLISKIALYNNFSHLYMQAITFNAREESEMFILSNINNKIVPLEKITCTHYEKTYLVYLI